MSKKPPISDDEKALFRDSMRDVKKKPHEARAQTKKASPRSDKAAQREAASTHPPTADSSAIDSLENLAEEDWHDGEDSIHFARDGLQRRVLQKLRRGQINIEARLDLHRLTGAEALTAVDHFIGQCQEQHIRWACIIHGKGHYSISTKPVLKNLLNQYLRKDLRILAFRSAAAKDGGTGALYVLIKSNRGNETQ